MSPLFFPILLTQPVLLLVLGVFQVLPVFPLLLLDHRGEQRSVPSDINLICPSAPSAYLTLATIPDQTSVVKGAFCFRTKGKIKFLVASPQSPLKVHSKSDCLGIARKYSQKTTFI